MPDTQRDKAAILALFADNTTALISPQDLRDFVVSAWGGYASIYVKGGVTAQTISATPAKMTGFAADGPASGATPAHASDQITIGVAGDYSVELLAGGFLGTNGSTIVLDIYVNGVTSGLPTLTRTLSTPALSASGATGGHLTLAAGAVVTVYVSSATGTSFTPSDACLRVSRLA